MTPNEMLERVKEIMEENNLSSDRNEQLKMLVIYAQARIDVVEEQLKEMETK